MKSVVIYDSLYGNTRQLAESLPRSSKGLALSRSKIPALAPWNYRQISHS
jgi:hypothetical protein